MKTMIRKPLENVWEDVKELVDVIKQVEEDFVDKMDNGDSQENDIFKQLVDVIKQVEEDFVDKMDKSIIFPKIILRF